MAKRPNRPNKNRSGRPGGFGKPGRPRGRKFGQGGDGAGRGAGGSRGKAGQGGKRRFSRGTTQQSDTSGAAPEPFEGEAAPRPAKRFQRAGRPEGQGERTGRGGAGRTGAGRTGAGRTGAGRTGAGRTGAGRGGAGRSGSGRGETSGAGGRTGGGARTGRGERSGGTGRTGGPRGKFNKTARRPAGGVATTETSETGERPRSSRPVGGKRFAKKGPPGVRPPGKFRGPKAGSKFGAKYGGKGGRKPYGQSRRGAGGRDAEVDIAPAGQAGPERLQKVLAAAGLGSRRECEELIVEGRVEVDRKVVTELGTKVDPLEQEIRVDGVALTSPKRVYYAVNKPPGVVCTNRDQSGRTRVIDLIKTDQRLFTVGRLDRTSEGLILVTNDGRLANLLTHPRYGVEKTYAALVEGLPSQRALDQLREGVHLAEGLAKAEEVRVKRRHPRTTELIIVLTEGRNREVRRMLARIGHKVLTLRRIAVGPLLLGNLPLGAHRRLTVEEIAALEAAVLGNKKKSRQSANKPDRGPRDRKSESRIPESDVLPLDESAELMDLDDDEDDEGELTSTGTRDVWADQESLADLLPPRAGDDEQDDDEQDDDEEDLDEEEFEEGDFDDDQEDEDQEDGDEEVEGDDDLDETDLEALGEEDENEEDENEEEEEEEEEEEQTGEETEEDADDILISDETLGPDENAHPGSIIGDKKSTEDADWK